MEPKHLLFLFMFTMLSCISSWGIVERERKYAKIKLPRIIRRILFPFRQNSFTLHNIIYVIIFYTIDILFILLYFIVTDRELLFALYILFFYIFCSIQVVIFMLLELIYWIRNKNKPRAGL